MTRRDLSVLLGTLAFGDDKLASDELAHSAAFAFDKLPVHSNPGGLLSRPVAKGQLPTGETIEMHESTLPPGQMPHLPHRHVHCEFMLIREGTLELVLDGRSEQLGPGGVAYAASGELHSLKNVGSVPANYFVIAIGGELKSGTKS